MVTQTSAGTSRSANFISLPPGNMANYVTAEGALDLKAYKTRITGSFSYGWLAQNDFVFESTRCWPPYLGW